MEEVDVIVLQRKLAYTTCRMCLGSDTGLGEMIAP